MQKIKVALAAGILGLIPVAWAAPAHAACPDGWVCVGCGKPLVYTPNELLSCRTAGCGGNLFARGLAGA